jgi:hypothetical protein
MSVLLRNRNLHPSFSAALTMVAAITSEALVSLHQATRRNNPEHSHFHVHRLRTSKSARSLFVQLSCYVDSLPRALTKFNFSRKTKAMLIEMWLTPQRKHRVTALDIKVGTG